MAKDNLLDLMVTDFEKTREKDVRVEQKQRVERRELDRKAQSLEKDLNEQRYAAEREAERRAWEEAERRTREKAEAAPPEMCGFVVGTQFEVRRCGEQVNGRWVVARIDPGAAGDQGRALWATRASGAPGALQFTERKLLDALHAGLVVRG